MHSNPAFRKQTDAENIRFARDQGFGMLAIAADDVPLVSHIPFLLSEDGTVADFHLVRSNPIVRALKVPIGARLAIQGPHSYISPDWYMIEDQVPTWNYLAVHLIGRVERRPDGELLDLLDRQSAVYEGRLKPKSPWTTSKMTKDVLERMMRQIVPCRMHVNQIDGTWKLNQNKAHSVRMCAADQVETFGMGNESGVLAAMMRKTLPND